MATVLASPAIQDFNVKLQKSFLIFPSQETKKNSFFLSNIDQVMNFNVQIVDLFTANTNYPPKIVVNRVKLALERVLVHYDFMVGRLKFNHELGRLEIDCNAAGAGFVVASSEFSLHELGNFNHPMSGLEQLAAQRLENFGREDDQPLCIFQITSFKCGGFAIGISINHVLFDGYGALMFLENLASQAFDDKPLAFVPCNNRHLLAARSPPRIESPYLNFVEPVSYPPMFDYQKEELDYKIFKLNASAIHYLMKKSTENGIHSNTTRANDLTVTIALIWRCKALSMSHYNEDTTCTIVNVTDVRSRLNPPLPPSYAGNAVVPAYASAKCVDIEKWPFWKLVEMISIGQSRVTDEYAKSVIDGAEMNKRVLPLGDYLVTSWLRLKIGQVEYPWGKPAYSGPVANHSKCSCPLIRDGAGVNALISLPPLEMKRFESYFHNFFKE